MMERRGMKNIFLLSLYTPIIRAFFPTACRRVDRTTYNQEPVLAHLHHHQYNDENLGVDAEEIHELKFNISNLLLRQQNNTLRDLEPVLADICEAAYSSQENTNDVEESAALLYLPEHLASMKLFMCASQRSQDHAGHFQIFSTTGSDSPTNMTTVTLPPNVLFSLNDPLSFIHTSLSHHNFEKSKKGGMLCDNREVIVWCEDDIHTLQYSSRVLDDMPFSQLHMGNFDGKDVEDTYLVELANVESILRTLKESLSIVISKPSESASTSATTCLLQSQDLNIIQNILQSVSSSQPIQSEQQQGLQTLIKLIDSAVESVRNDLRSATTSPEESPHFVLVSHSTQTSIVAQALSKWKEERLSKANAVSSTSAARQKQHIEDLLHQAITVVTFGNVCQRFCDGPAYIHISMYDDCWTNLHGVTEKNSGGGGRNAVYLHAWSPFPPQGGKSNNLKDHDSHNMNACMIQFLSLVMRINGITSFRDLYNAARYVDPRSILDINPKYYAIDYANHKLGDLVIPSTIDLDLLPAMIRATGGDQWQWTKNIPHDKRYDEEQQKCLPDPEEASVYLEEFFGYSAYEEIKEVCFNANR
jgi:hypothetical protein